MLIMSRTVSIVAGHDLPTVDILTTLSQLNNSRLQVIQHIPAFLEKFVYDFSLFRRNIVAHSSLSECFALLFSVPDKQTIATWLQCTGTCRPKCTRLIYKFRTTFSGQSPPWA
jgi:hypothetical protein